MPIVIFLIVVILIAQIGFWDTLAAFLGGALMILLMVALGLALVVAAIRWAMSRRPRF